MFNIDFLKQQHLSAFETKRETHKKQVRDLYYAYVSEMNPNFNEKWRAFSNFYAYYADRFCYEIYDSEYIVGTNWHWMWQGGIYDIPRPYNYGHFIVDFKDILEKGVLGKLKEIQNRAVDEKSAGQETALRAFSSHIKKYAQTASENSENATPQDKVRLLRIASDCAYIAENPPTTFRQALQFVWFVQCFLELEAGNAAISFGRVDQYLYPYYKADIESCKITAEEAKNLIMCFYIKVSEGNESCMLTVGGEEENELTTLFLEAQAILRMRQPSIALRVSKTMQKKTLEAANKLVLTGNGMPAYFNDEVIINGIKKLGFSSEDAENYGVVGCYEAAPQGIYANTVAGSFNLYDSFDAFVRQGTDYASFEAFLEAYKRYFEEYYKNSLLPVYKDSAEHNIHLVSPFASCLFRVERFLYGLNILGVGVLIDSLCVIKALVFDEGYITLEKLVAQSDTNFDDTSLYEKILGLKEYYGSNNRESNDMARGVTRFIGETIQRYEISDNVVASPALFMFTADIYQRDYKATLNGRRQGELLSYGIMPCATPHKNETISILSSSACVSAEYFPNGCPLMISLPQKELENGGIHEALIKTCFELGLSHLAINTVNQSVLKEAKRNPKEHSELIVKISGYSTQFTKLDERIQDAVIERAAKES